MKNYLAKFQNASVEARISIQKVLGNEPSKPAKPSFAGFDGAPEAYFSDNQTQIDTATLSQEDFGKVQSGQPSKPSKPSFDGFDGSSPSKVQPGISSLTKPATCPHCHDAADLQDQTLDVWWCGGCRKFFDSQGQAIPPVSSHSPLTLEQIKAERLATELLAAGCGFLDDGEHFGVRMPKKISAELLARLNAADRYELRQAAATLRGMEERQGWVS